MRSYEEILQSVPMEELLSLAAWLTDRYTSKESTSVPYEKAETLMEAILFCLCQEPESEDAEGSAASGTVKETELRAVDWKKSSSLRGQYEAGYELVVKKVRRAKAVYESILPDFEDYENQALRHTILKEMPQFFLRYDPRFSPQDHCLFLEYPVLMDLTGYNGVDRILSYLLCIKAEQTFLSRIPPEMVRDIFSGRHGYARGEVFNLCESVMDEFLKRYEETGHKEAMGKEQLLEEIIKTGYDNNRSLYAYLLPCIRGR